MDRCRLYRQRQSDPDKFFPAASIVFHGDNQRIHAVIEDLAPTNYLRDHHKSPLIRFI